MADKDIPAPEAIGWSWGAAMSPLERQGFGWARCTGLVFLVVFLTTVFAFVGGFFVFVHTLTNYETKPDVQADAIVTLTGGSQRIDDALQLLAQGRGKRMLISGVNEHTTREELSRLNPGQAELFGCCIDLDYGARNTIGNAIQTRRWARNNGFQTIIVVTSNYHMPRTLVELEHVMPQIERIPYAVSNRGEAGMWWRNGNTFRIVASEYVKFLAAWIRTRIEKDPERSSAARFLGKPVKIIVEPLSR